MQDNHADEVSKKIEEHDRLIREILQERNQSLSRSTGWSALLATARSRDFYIALSMAVATLGFAFEVISEGINDERIDTLQRFVDLAIELSQPSNLAE